MNDVEERITYLRLAEMIIELLKRPLTGDEIWEEAVKTGLSARINFQEGKEHKTPWESIRSKIQIDIKEVEGSIFSKGGKPQKFFLKKLMPDGIFPIAENITASSNKNKEKGEKKEKEKKERECHPLVCWFAKNYLDMISKTIYHEISDRKPSGFNKWLHPDIVGVYFNFISDNYDKTVANLQKALTVTTMKIFSFEIKVGFSYKTYKEGYFQAVANSSWANEGYLVIITDVPFDETTYSPWRDEIKRLNDAFGIGLIEIVSSDISKSKILFKSKVRDLDWATIKRIKDENENFEDFMDNVVKISESKKIESEKFDPILTHDKIIEYIGDIKIREYIKDLEL